MLAVQLLIASSRTAFSPIDMLVSMVWLSEIAACIVLFVDGSNANSAAAVPIFALTACRYTYDSNCQTVGRLKVEAWTDGIEQLWRRWA